MDCRPGGKGGLKGNQKSEPLAVGGYTSLEKVYSFQIVPESLEKEFHHLVLGAQANLWTEYMSHTNQVEYMLLPRLLALSEVLWGTANQETYLPFVNRVLHHMHYILGPLKYNYAKSIFEITLHTETGNGKLYAILQSPLIKQLYYGATKSLEKNYKNKIEIDQSGTLYYGHSYDGRLSDSLLFQQEFTVNLATGKTMDFKNTPHQNYQYNFESALVNGIKASKDYLGKDWIGFSGENFDAVIDLMNPTPIKELRIGFLERHASWIYLPSSMEIWTSLDGKNYKKMDLPETFKIAESMVIHLGEHHSETCRFIRLLIKNQGLIPENKPGAGNQAWLFMDEIELY
jgi:hexosaminidase